MLDLLRECREGSFSRVVVDLTHGTNIHVNTLVFAVLVLRELLKLEVEAYAAPVLGRPGEGVEVRYQDITAIIGFYDYVLALSNLFRLDERPLEDLRRRYDREREERKLIFTEASDLCDHVKGMMGNALKVRDALLALVKALKLALPTVAYEKVKALQRSINTTELLKGVHNIYRELLDDVVRGVKGKGEFVEEHSKTLSLLLPSLAVAALIARDRLVKLFSPSNSINAYLSAMKLYIDNKMTLQLLITANEASHLYTVLELGLGGEVRVEERGSAWSLAEDLARTYRYIKELKGLSMLRPLSTLIAPMLASQVKEHRNKLAHAGLLKGKTSINLDECSVHHDKGVELDPIKVESSILENLSRIVDRLTEIKHKCLSSS